MSLRLRGRRSSRDVAGVVVSASSSDGKTLLPVAEESDVRRSLYARWPRGGDRDLDREGGSESESDSALRSGDNLSCGLPLLAVEAGELLEGAGIGVVDRSQSASSISTLDAVQLPGFPRRNVIAFLLQAQSEESDHFTRARNKSLRE